MIPSHEMLFLVNRMQSVNAAVCVSTLPEITTVDFTGLTAVNFVTGVAGKYVLISRAGGDRACFWFKVDTVETEPVVGGVSHYYAVDVAGSDTENVLATDLRTSINSALGWFATSSGAVVTVTDNVGGTRTDASAGNSGTTVTVTQQGS